MAQLGPVALCILAFGYVAAAAETTALQSQIPLNGEFKLRAKRNCQMGECGPEEYFLICRKCPICCMDSASTMQPFHPGPQMPPPPPPPPQPAQCCHPIPIPVPVPMSIAPPQPAPLPEVPQTQCCYAPRPSPQCCQAPPPSPPQIIMCCQARPEPANPCCQAAMAATSQAPQPNCVCSAPRPIPCRCSAPPPAPPPPGMPTDEIECGIAACPIYISRCPKNPAAQQLNGCKRRRFRRDTYHSLLQRLSHNIPFEF